MDELSNTDQCTPCIDPVQQAHFEKMTKVKDSVMKQLKGLTYSQAKEVLDQVSWEISFKAIIK